MTMNIYERAWELARELRQIDSLIEDTKNAKISLYNLCIKLAEFEDRISKIESNLSLFFPDEYPHGQS
jgi:hypothetical protein